jgi:hypothetical protein
MNTKLVEDITAAVLYEGYLLYPYRASAIKNKKRWNFGVLYPRDYVDRQSGADAWKMQTECLITGSATSKLGVRIRFLHLTAVDEKQEVQGAHAREIDLSLERLSELASYPARRGFAFALSKDQQPVAGAVETNVEQLAANLFRIHVAISNTGSFDGTTREEALLKSLVSTHTILGVEGGEFVSLLEPPPELADAVVGCKNVGTWPVLVGADGQRDAMLSSPIILYDYPKIAPESPGALFDGTEIDEILTLRIMTLTDQEKIEMARTDERARQILERTESMPPEQFMKLHGVLRGIRRVPEETP